MAETAFNSVFCGQCQEGFQLDESVCRRCNYSPVLLWMLMIALFGALCGYITFNAMQSLRKTTIAAGPMKVLLKQLINNFQTVRLTVPYLSRRAYHMSWLAQIAILKAAQVWRDQSQLDANTAVLEFAVCSMVKEIR